MLPLPGNKTRLSQNDPVLKDVRWQLRVFLKTSSHENEILSLSWCISKSFYQI